MRIFSSQHRAAWLNRLRPRSLGAQFAVALSAMAALIVAGGATAFLALFATGDAARRFSEEQLARARHTQSLQQQTLQIERLAERMISADSREQAHQTYARILGELDALDELTAQLAVSEDMSVLDLHQSSQLFRSSAHVLARLRDAAEGPGPASASTSGALRSYREEMQTHAQALAQAAREQSDRLARAHQAAVLRVVDASQASAYWVVAWLAFSLLMAWLIARVFLGRRIIARLQQVSRSLLSADAPGDAPPQVDVQGDDEIGAMARAVERFLSDRRQLATTRTLLEAEQQRLSAIIDNTADSIVVLQGGRVLQLNRAAERMFGLPNPQAAGLPGDSLLADFDWTPGAVPGTARDALARCRDGSTIPVEVSLNPVSSGAGHLLVLVIRDATLRRQAERHLIAARDAAEAARETQAVFLANISHELRTPLNGILGFAQMLRRGESLNERQARGLKIIEECGQHLLMLIDDILDLARIEKGRLELHPVDVELPGFLQAVCEIVRIRAQEKRLDFVYEPAPDLPAVVVVDDKRLRQVLLNLLSNAIKFGDAGRVTLRAWPVAPAAGRSAGGLRFEVEDEGIGMNEAQLARLFQPFAQVAEQKRREGGAGLGLSISRQLVRLMGGDIQARSREGRGSVFSFEIEAPAPPAAARARPAGAPAGGPTNGVEVPHLAAPGQGPEVRPDPRTVVRGAHVLLVEDNAINRELVVELLQAAGVVVSVAGDGREALEMLERQRFDAVLMDCLMPVMDGYAATRALRQRPELRDLPVIALTANAMVGDRDKALAAGMSDHIAKPVRLDTLLAALARWLPTPITPGAPPDSSASAAASSRPAGARA
ncbi:MAG: response regulator [Piscinibacter sp.]|uniref:ATP-binding protein n=1 Tax=Piscinibacter TaxID=1114981 RepID=UPI000FDD51FC|nr:MULTISPECIES: ATP-binding protein [Piscinibacter]MCW5664231.1 response regulator [Piscinibacter sp.]